MPKQTGRIATKDLLKEIGLISVKTNELDDIVKALPNSSVKDAFTYSVTNLEKKIEKFTVVSVPLSDEQKEKLKAFRRSLIAENTAEIPALHADVETTIKGKKKH